MPEIINWWEVAGALVVGGALRVIYDNRKGIIKWVDAQVAKRPNDARAEISCSRKPEI